MCEIINQIIFPDTLVEMWKFSHEDKTCSIAENEFAEYWQTLISSLSEHLKRKRAINQEEALDEATSFLVDLFTKQSPQNILAYSHLLKNLNKYLAQKNNPVQYEMNNILRCALLKLEKDGIIQRDSIPKGKTITTSTRFKLVKNNSDYQASIRDYEKNCAKIPVYQARKAPKDAEKVKMISPADANDLVIKLLEAFGGWIEFQDLQQTMKNHIPEQMQIVKIETPISIDKEEKKQNIIENLASDETLYSHIEAFNLLQGEKKSNETAEEIWKRISIISDQVFCLYYLPKKFYGADVRQEDIGKTSTISDQGKKIDAIIKDELEFYQDYCDESPQVLEALGEIVKNIFHKLQGRCTEKGYNMDLYKDKEFEDE